jgi:SAM-dependent methyltransferase
MSYSFNEKHATKLCHIMGQNKSDKGGIPIEKCWHNYTTFYYSIFKDIQFYSLRVFELGIGTNDVTIQSNMGENGRPGASLYGWRDFFPNSKIFGADIDRKILFETDKIKTYYCDQTKPEIIKYMWLEQDLKEDFDIIIEDGLHTFLANVCFFENSIHKLKKNGYYIIEDIRNDEIHLFTNILQKWKAQYRYLSFSLIKIPSTVNNIDNNLLVVHKMANSDY